MSIVMMSGGGIMAAGAGGDVITLSGETTIAFKFGGTNADAHIKVDNDGNVYEQVNFGGYTQVDTGTDWVRPTASSPGLYEVRYTNLINDPIFTGTAAEDTWHSLSSGDFILRQRQLGGGFGNTTSTFDIEIRYNGGSVLASGQYTLTCNTEL